MIRLPSSIDKPISPDVSLSNPFSILNCARWTSPYSSPASLNRHRPFHRRLPEVGDFHETVLVNVSYPLSPQTFCRSHHHRQHRTHASDQESPIRIGQASSERQNRARDLDSRARRLISAELQTAILRLLAKVAPKPRRDRSFHSPAEAIGVRGSILRMRLHHIRRRSSWR